LLEALFEVFISVVNLAAALGKFALTLFAAYWFVIAWIAYWLWIARWPDLREQLRRGGAVALVLLAVVVAMVWGLLSGPIWDLPGVPSVLEKLIIVAVLIAVAFGCGSLQDYFGWTPPAVEIAGPPEGGATTSHAHGHH
jgi:hypothetical protein